MLVSFTAAKRWGEVIGFDVSVETLLGRFRLTPGSSGGDYAKGTVRVESERSLGFGSVRAAFERASFRIAVLDGAIQQAVLEQGEEAVFGGLFVPSAGKFPAIYTDEDRRVFDIGLLPAAGAQTPFVLTEGIWHRGQRLQRFQNRGHGIGLQSLFQRRLTARVVEGRVDILDGSIQQDGRVLRGAILIRPDPRVVIEFDSLRVFIHLAGGLISHAQLFVRNGKLAQSEFQRLEALGFSTKISFPEDA